MTLSARFLGGIERSLAPLDLSRRALYRALVPWIGAKMHARSVRVGFHGSLVVASSLVAAVLAPLWLLALGPLVLGVPHLVADLRYLVVRPGLHLRRGAWVPGVLVLLSSVAVDLRWGLVGVALVPLFARGPVGRRLGLAVLPIGLVLLSIRAHDPTLVVLAHAHNLVAVGLWLLLGTTLGEAGLSNGRRLPLIGFGLGFAAIVCGWLDPWLALGSSVPGGPSLRTHVRTLAPGLDPVWATRWVVAFAYAQSVHYGLWLRVIPEEARDRPSSRSWKASLRALRADLGDRSMALAVLLGLGLAVWGLFDLSGARDGYLRLALFHGPLELAVLAWTASEGRAVLRP